jgi:bifunctional non-homologous end joining protein LigD
MLRTRTPAKANSPARKAAGMPAYRPQLATLVDAAPVGEHWVHELKYDGYRIGCTIQNGAATLISRNGKDWTSKFGLLAARCAELQVEDALIDGEVTIVMPDGRTSFQALQNSFSTGARTGLTYFLFDLLYLNGQDLRQEPLSTRKKLLRDLIPSKGILSYSEQLRGDGPKVLAHACKLGLEGIVSKREDRPHRDKRSEEWLKSKCQRRQELVVGGFTDPSGSRAGIGALLLGYYEGEHLRFAGKVGTGRGFTARYLTDLRASLDEIVSERCPFSVRPPARMLKGVHWVRPVRVVEVAFSEWTTGGSVRHPSLLGFREDKLASSVTREKAEASKTQTRTNKRRR